MNEVKNLPLHPRIPLHGVGEGLGGHSGAWEAYPVQYCAHDR